MLFTDVKVVLSTEEGSTNIDVSVTVPVSDMTNLSSLQATVLLPDKT